MKKTKTISLVPDIEMQDCECGHTVPIDNATMNEEGEWICNKCLEKIVAYIKKFRPILFSTMMVQAILDDRKTMTRRTRGLEKINENPDAWRFDNFMETLGDTHACFYHKITNELVVIKFPFGTVGSGLWVRETIRQNGELGLEYVADGEGVDEDLIPEDYGPYGGSYSFRNIPSIHMPKWAARIWLEIIGVRVERLQDVTYKDAVSEGIETEWDGTAYWYKNYEKKGSAMLKQDPISSFYSLWVSINGHESLELNPWVWVVEFKQIEKPE